jgi:hypothetical protein
MATISMTEEPARAARTLRHLVLLYSGEREFLTGTTFVRDGVTAGEPVLVILDAQRTKRLHTELDGMADQVHFVTAETSRRLASFLLGVPCHQPRFGALMTEARAPTWARRLGPRTSGPQRTSVSRTGFPRAGPDLAAMQRPGRRRVSTTA